MAHLIVLIGILWATIAGMFEPRFVEVEHVEHRAFRIVQTDRYDTLILAAAAEFGVDPFLLKSLLFHESGFKSGVTRDDTGATGIAQFTPGGRSAVVWLRKQRGLRGGAARFNGDDARNPANAIPAAAEVMRYLISIYGETAGITAYNTGPGGGKVVVRHGLKRMNRKVQWFVNSVLKKRDAMRLESGLPPSSIPKRPPREQHGKPATKTPRPAVAMGDVHGV